MVRPPYEVVHRLYALADLRWPEIDAAYPQVNLLELPIYRFLNFVYGWVMDRVPHDQREQFLYELHAPLPGREGEMSDAGIEVEGQQFMDAMNNLQES